MKGGGINPRTRRDMKKAYVSPLFPRHPSCIHVLLTDGAARNFLGFLSGLPLMSLKYVPTSIVCVCVCVRECTQWGEKVREKEQEEKANRKTLRRGWDLNLRTLSAVLSALTFRPRQKMLIWIRRLFSK